MITTEEDGSRIEALEDAIDEGHEYYGSYWELVSIEIVLDGCCGGANRILINTYLGDPTGVFGWGMSYVEAGVGVSPDIVLSGSMTVTSDGLDAVEVGVTLHW